MNSFAVTTVAKPSARAGATHAAPARSASPNAFMKKHIHPYTWPNDGCLALNKVDWPVDAQDAVLLVHDMQQYWLDFFVDAQPLIDHVGQLVAAARAVSMPVVYTQGERPRHAAERALGLQMWGQGLAHPSVTAQDCAITAALAPMPQDFVINKLRVSAFFGTPLADVLQKIGRRQVIVCGVFAHHGVMMTSADAFMRNYQVQLVADAVADYSEDDHWMALRYVAQTSGCIHLLASTLEALGHTPPAPHAT
jgi:bifunctional isochorismate lyase / aryl carrier protein